MKFGLKINTEFPIKTDDTLYDHLRPHVLSWISDQKTNHTVLSNIFNGFYNLKDIRGQHGANKAQI
jgi:hypothetical protein